MATTKKPTFTEADALRLAAEAHVHPKTARRALELGAGALRAVYDQERVAEAAKKLKLVLPIYRKDAS